MSENKASTSKPQADNAVVKGETELGYEASLGVQESLVTNQTITARASLEGNLQGENGKASSSKQSSLKKVSVKEPIVEKKLTVPEAKGSVAEPKESLNSKSKQSASDPNQPTKASEAPAKGSTNQPKLSKTDSSPVPSKQSNGALTAKPSSKPSKPDSSEDPTPKLDPKTSKVSLNNPEPKPSSAKPEPTPKPELAGKESVQAPKPTGAQTNEGSLAPPQGNSKSKTPRDDKGGSKPHWEQLYDLSKIKQETREIIVKEKERQEEKYLKECTFKPNIHGEETILKERNPMETYERNKEWQQTVKEKRALLSETQNQKTETFCTFKPQLNKTTEAMARLKDYNISNQIGIEKYLERQQLARAEKERVEKIMSGVASVKGKGEGKTGYAAKFARNKQNEEEDVLMALRQGNFAQGALILHNYLHVMDIKF